MKSQWQYCGACDRTVRVLYSEVSTEESQAPAADHELICLDIGRQCTGGMCPLGAAAPSAMVRRLVHNGIPTGNLETAAAHCPVCEEDAEMVLFGDQQACCSLCGSIGSWNGTFIGTS